MTMLDIDRSFAVSLHLDHPTIDPAAMTAALGLTPDHQHRIGEQRRTPQGELLKGNYAENAWSLSLDLAGVIDLVPFLEDLLSRLELQRDFFASLTASGGRAELFCGIYLDSNWDESIPHQLSGRLAALRINLRLDAYPKEYRRPDWPPAKLPPRVVPFASENAEGVIKGGRVIHRFLHDGDFMTSSAAAERASRGDIVGVEYSWFNHPELAWVFFQKPQVVQIIPDGVQSYWYTAYEDPVERKTGKGILVVENSPWLRSLNQCHLAACRHFILMFNDSILEVIAEDLRFGRGPFQGDDHPELNLASASSGR
jgi:Domain of unknown function (DUF4279)